MTRVTRQIPQQVIEELDGRNWSAEAEGKRVKILVDGTAVLVLTSGYLGHTVDRGPMKAVCRKLRRALIRLEEQRRKGGEEKCAKTIPQPWTKPKRPAAMNALSNRA